MQKTTGDPRIAGLLSGDRFWSLASLALLWVLYAYVLWSVMPYLDTPEELYLLAIGGALVLLFNTASILVMVAHLSEDRDEIYGLDLHYLDAANKNK